MKSFIPFSILLLLSLGGLAQVNDSVDENKAIVTRAFEIVGAGDFDRFDEVIAEDYLRHCPATPDVSVQSLNAFKDFIRQDRIAVPDQTLEITKLVAEGDHVAFWAIYKGTQTGPAGPFPPSGKRVELEFAGMHRLEDGKIAETWVVWDNISFLTQLGHFPPGKVTPDK